MCYTIYAIRFRPLAFRLLDLGLELTRSFDIDIGNLGLSLGDSVKTNVNISE